MSGYYFISWGVSKPDSHKAGIKKMDEDTKELLIPIGCFYFSGPLPQRGAQERSVGGGWFPKAVWSRGSVLLEGEEKELQT